MPPFDQVPDKPQSFGYKVFWFALKASDPAAVVEALELGEATPANWASGLAAALSSEVPEKGPWVFISPPVDGWSLVVSPRLPHPVDIEEHRAIGESFDRLFSRLMQHFDDVQFFGNHRGVDLVTWARAIKGKPVRAFAYAESQVLANVGKQTPEEAKLGFADLSGLSPSDAEEALFKIEDEEYDRHGIPDEGDVTDLAALWSLNPIEFENEDHAPGCGLLVHLPVAFLG